MEVLDPITIKEKRTRHTPVSGSKSYSQSFASSLFYLGTREDFALLPANPIIKKYFSDNYLSAKTRLIRIIETGQLLPDVLVIDLPFSKREVTGFVNWLKQVEELKYLPIIYNKAFLTNIEVAELQQAKLTDDIMDISSNYSNLIQKARFLRKTRERSTTIRKNASDKQRIIRASLNQKFNYYSKRLLDITLASVLLLVTLPLFLIIAAAIRIESKGPVFYNANRAGRGFRIFKFYKFRTMIVDADKKVEELKKLNLYAADSTAKFFKIKNDPRMTKVGAILRNTSLDELPQFFNVIKGDMSIVGNRPLPLYEAATLTTDEWAERFMAPAGITGLWQIKKRGSNNMSVEERLNLDITYARSNSFMNDLWIMVNTPPALLQKSNV